MPGKKWEEKNPISAYCKVNRRMSLKSELGVGGKGISETLVRNQISKRKHIGRPPRKGVR